MKIPYRCPICNGTGLVPNGFYRAIGVDNWSTSSIAPEMCRSCNGKGIIYVQEEDDVEKDWIRAQGEF